MQSHQKTRVYLRGVNLGTLVEKYLNKQYSKLTHVVPTYVDSAEQATPLVTNADESAVKSYEHDLGSERTFAEVGCKYYHDIAAENREYNCMNCLLKIAGFHPVGIPVRRQVKNDIVYYHMVDIFCSFSCALTELRKRSSNTLYANSAVYLSELFTLCLGENAKLAASLDRRLLTIFNGYLSWGEFHAKTVFFIECPMTVVFLPVTEFIEKDA